MVVTLRPMTDDEFDSWQRELAEVFVAEMAASGSAMPEDAVERELAQYRTLLPDRAQTERMLVVIAVDDVGASVGHAWVALDHPHASPDTAFVYDIEVQEEFRGKGFGRQLLAELERAVASAGVGAIELNVFGNNGTAIGLYSSTGYQVTSQQMRKVLTD